ncbi:MAG: cobalamin-dependent protein [Chloroflexi bacterium]|nr:cobalamin-dependent protein [Chloroflexota bacterium]
MKVLLIATNRHGRYMSNLQAQPVPIGLAYIAGYLDPEQHSTKLLDLMFADDYLGEVESAVKDFQPDLVGLSIRNLDNGSNLNPRSVLPITKEVTDLIRSISHATIVCGGPAFSIFPNECFDYIGPDVGITGSGGDSFSDLADRLERGESYKDLPGLVFRADKKIVVTEQKAASGVMKPPRLEDLDLDRYAEAGFGIGVITKWFGNQTPSLGANSNDLDPQNLRPIPEVIAEVKDLKQRLGLSKFFFIANGFNVPPNHAKSFCQTLIDTDLKIEWNTGLVPRSCDRELIVLMKKAGCSLAIIGDLVVDAYDPQDLAVRLEQMLRVCHLCEEGDLPYTVGQTFGAPGETRETVEQKLVFLRNINPAVANLRVGIRMLPGSRSTDQARSDGRIFDDGDLIQPTFYIAESVKDWIVDHLQAAANDNPKWSVD